jgi:hypothetical protein
MQPSTPAQTGVREWITKEETAKQLDRSVRTVLAMAAAGTIKSKTERDPKRRGQKVTLFHAGAVAALAEKRENGTAAEKPAQDRKPAIIPPAALQSTDISLTQALVERLLNPPPAVAVPPAPRPWLTLDEAAEFSGLTKRWLEAEAIRILRDEGTTPIAIKVRDMGRGTHGGRWRFLRSDLEKG